MLHSTKCLAATALLSVASFRVAAAATPEVVFGTAVATGSPISQVYTTDSALYYDVVRPPTEGSSLYVIHQTVFYPLTFNSSLGTPFDFIPVVSSYVSAPHVANLAYGHVALSSNHTLRLTVDVGITTASTPGVPYLAVVNKADDISQLKQFWSLEYGTGVLTFVGTRFSTGGASLSGYEPIHPLASPELVHVVPAASTVGKFHLYGHAVNPCPWPPNPTNAIVCPLDQASS